jgi:APA family basic amino acid/polyamine antiporter
MDAENNNSAAVSRKLGLAAGVFLFVGYIVGASIFILPGSLGAITGPGLFIAYILAALPAIFGCAVAAQVGSAYPVSGASYVMASRVLSPYWGAVVVWLIIMFVTMVVPVVSLGFSDYLNYFIPDLDRTTVAAMTVVFFVLVNICGVSLAASIQGFLVVVFCAALLLFGLGGIIAGDISRMSPLLPNGITPVLLATVTVYFSYTGAFVISEMAGEIKDPSRNIHRAILIGFGMIMLLYVLVPISLMMNLDWNSLEGPAALTTAAENFLPPGLVNFVAIGALLAAGTTINGMLMSQSRDVLAASGERLLPRYFARVNVKTHVPVRGIIFLGVLSLMGIFYGATVKEYVDMAVLGFMLLQAILGIAVYRLPLAVPTVYDKCAFKYPPFWHKFFSLGSVIISVAIMGVITTQSWQMSASLFGFLLLVSVVHLANSVRN